MNILYTIEGLCYVLIAVYQVTNEEPVYSSRSDFLTVSQTAAFVDKTLMIKQVFNNVEAIMITAPRRFGKSTNLDMLKTFLSIPSDNQSAQDIRDVFQQLNIFKEERDFFEEHFGAYPVLHISFITTRPIRNEDLAVNIIKDKIYETYRMHKYLHDSDKLSFTEREYCEKWSDMGNYRDFTNDDVRVALRRMTEVLYNHFDGKKVMILVDEYDALITSAAFHVSDGTLENIVSLVTDMLCEIVKENPFVERTIITGITYVVGSGLSGLNNMKIFKFLEDHSFSDFYGFTEEEVDELFKDPKFNLTEDLIKQANEMYDGYQCKNGKHLYNPYSVLNFLQSGSIDNYWIKSGYICKLKEAFKLPQIKEMIETLLAGKLLELNFNKHISLEDIIDLQNIFNDKKVKNSHSSVDLLLFHLLELGYLTYVCNPEKVNCSNVKIPNSEVAESLLVDLKEYYVTTYNMDRNLFKDLNCKNYNEKFSKITSFTKRYRLTDIIFKLGKIIQTVLHGCRMLL